MIDWSQLPSMSGQHGQYDDLWPGGGGDNDDEEVDSLDDAGEGVLRSGESSDSLAAFMAHPPHHSQGPQRNERMQLLPGNSFPKTIVEQERSTHPRGAPALVHQSVSRASAPPTAAPPPAAFAISASNNYNARNLIMTRQQVAQPQPFANAASHANNHFSDTTMANVATLRQMLMARTTSVDVPGDRMTSALFQQQASSSSHPPSTAFATMPSSAQMQQASSASFFSGHGMMQQQHQFPQNVLSSSSSTMLQGMGVSSSSQQWFAAPGINPRMNPQSISSSMPMERLQPSTPRRRKREVENESKTSTSMSDTQLPFPVKLHRILSDPAYKEYITWLPHGRAWRILKPKVFAEKVVPKFFRSSKYTSFMRQVNGWGFQRITEGRDLNAYYHTMFLRGMPNLCSKMKRLIGKQQQQEQLQEELPAPDFYRIHSMAPLPVWEDMQKNGDNNGKPEVAGLLRARAANALSVPGTPHWRGIPSAQQQQQQYDPFVPTSLPSSSPRVSLTPSEQAYLIHQNKILLQHGIWAEQALMLQQQQQQQKGAAAPAAQQEGTRNSSGDEGSAKAGAED